MDFSEALAYTSTDLEPTIFEKAYNRLEKDNIIATVVFDID